MKGATSSQPWASKAFLAGGEGSNVSRTNPKLSSAVFNHRRLVTKAKTDDLRVVLGASICYRMIGNPNCSRR